MDGLLLKKSHLTNETILDEARSCRWLDTGRYFQWEGSLLVSDQGDFLIGGDSLCVKYNYNINGDDGKEFPNIMSLKECRDICGQRDGCRYYKWHEPIGNRYDYGCDTYATDGGGMWPTDNVIAGSMDCSEDSERTNETSAEVKLLRYSPHYFANSQWIYEDMYLMNPATGNVLTFTSEEKLEVLPKINTVTADKSQQWILDYNGTSFNSFYKLFINILLVFDHIAGHYSCYEAVINSIDNDEDVKYEDAENYCRDRNGSLINPHLINEVS